MNKTEIKPSPIITLTFPLNQESRNYKVEFHGLRIDAKSGDTVSYNHETKEHFLNGQLIK